jgi:molybdenum cofactor cytidylyltransferase
VSGVAAIVLAAGQGARFGSDFKLLATLDGAPLVRRTTEAALASDAHPIIVVLGHRCAEVAQALRDFDVTIIENIFYRDGLSTSLKAGFAALSPAVEAAVVLLGDMPRVSERTINQLIACWRAAGRPSAVIPTLAGRRGNPVVLSQALAPEIANLTGDAGAGRLLRDWPGVLEVAVDDPAVLEDIDTPEALHALGSWPDREAT